MEHRVRLTPLTERLIEKVRDHLSQGEYPKKHITIGQAIDWIIHDAEWCKPGVPAYGRWSPVLLGLIEDALAEEKAAHDPSHGRTNPCRQ